MLTRRSLAVIGAALFAPFVSRIPDPVEQGIPARPPLVFGPRFEGTIVLAIHGTAGEVAVAGPVYCRHVGGHWVFSLDPELKAKLNDAEQREIAALTAAGEEVFEAL